MSRNCRIPASWARYAAALRMTARFSRIPLAIVGLAAMAAAAALRSASKLSLPPRM
jgi:hypothetical protein